MFDQNYAQHFAEITQILTVLATHSQYHDRVTVLPSKNHTGEKVLLTRDCFYAYPVFHTIIKVQTTLVSDGMECVNPFLR